MQDQMPYRRTISLAATVSLVSTMVAVLVMSIYAFFQYIGPGDHTLGGLAVQHGMHTVALGVLIYLIVHLTLHLKFVLVIDEIYIKMYKAAKGDTSELATRTKIRELESVIEGINLLQRERSKKEKGGKKMERAELQINDMACQGCADTIQKALEGMSGVSEVDVKIQDKIAHINYNSDQTDIAALEDCIRNTGYTPEQV